MWRVEISIHLQAVGKGLEQLPTTAKNDDLFFFHGSNFIERESSFQLTHISGIGGITRKRQVLQVSLELSTPYLHQLTGTTVTTNTALCTRAS